MMQAKRTTALVGVVALASLAVGCQSGGAVTASPSALPKVYTSTVFEHVTYPSGKPTGKYEDSPWVQTIRVYEAELAWARAHYDWTSPQLTKIARQNTISRLAWYQVFDVRDKKYGQTTPAGPSPVTIFNIRQDGKDGVLVTACRANNWSIAKGNVSPDVVSTKGNYVEYVVAKDGGNYGYIFGEFDYSEKSCDISKANPVYFNPLPTYSEPGERDVKLTTAILASLGKSTDGAPS